MIVQDKIWLSRASSFNDPFDGKFTLFVEKNPLKVRAAVDREDADQQCDDEQEQRFQLLERLERLRHH